MNIKLHSLLILLFALATANTFGQIPNSGFENWYCIVPTTYNITIANELSVMDQYKDSLIGGGTTIYYWKYFSPNGDGHNDLIRISTQPANAISDSIASFFVSYSYLCSDDTIYKSSSSMSQWAGTDSSLNPVPQGIYKRDMSIALVNGDNFTINDSIQIFRFDSTTQAYYMNPVGWGTTNSYSTSSFFAVTRDTSHYPSSVGNYSVRIENNTAQIDNLSGLGVIESGTLSPPRPAFPITGHPTSLTGYYKYHPQNGDTMLIQLSLYKNGIDVSNNNNNNNKFTSTTAASNWTSFNIPLSYSTPPDSGYIILAAYNAGGYPPQYIPYGNSVLNVDNLNFDTLITGISEVNEASNVSVYPNPSIDNITIETKTLSKNSTLSIYNIEGQLLLQQALYQPKKEVNISSFAKGIYILKIENEEGIAVRKIIKE